MRFRTALLAGFVSLSAACAATPDASDAKLGSSAHALDDAKGPELARCWAQDSSTGDSTRSVVCQRTAQAGVKEVWIGTANGFGQSLDASAPTTVYGSNEMPDSLEAHVTLDSAQVGGLGGDLRLPNATFAFDGATTQAHPISVNSSVALWQVKIVAEVAVDGSLDARRMDLDNQGNSVGIDAIHFSAAQGQSTQLLVLGSSDGLAGEATLGGSDGTQFTLKSAGTYFARAGGLVKAEGQSSGASDLPSFLSCSVAAKDGGGNQLSCTTIDGNAPTLTMLTVTVDDATKKHSQIRAFYSPQSNKAQVIGADGNVATIALPGAVPMLDLDDASFPITVSLSATLSGQTGFELGHDGEVVGLGNPFSSTPITTTFDVASRDALPADAPFVARAPLHLWKVTVSGDAQWAGKMDDYSVTTASAWGTQASGTSVAVKNAFLAVLDGNQVKSQTLYLPVDATTTSLTGKTLDGAAFTVTGAGAYVVDGSGFHAAQ